MKKKRETKNNIGRLYLAVSIVIAIALLFAVFAIANIVNDRSAEIAESNLHALDEMFAEYCRDMDSEGKVSIDFARDENGYVAYIDAEGNVINSCNGEATSFNVNNIFRYLATARISNLSCDEACKLITGGENGKFEFYMSSQTKVLLYTYVGSDDAFVIRMIPRKSLENSQNIMGSDFNYILLIEVIAIVLLILMVYQFTVYTRRVEESNARHDLMAADNDLVSFTYHSSIASFEVTGAVEKSFGAEIAKRGQIDWNNLSKRLHPDDQSLLRNISKAIKDGESKYTTEFRMIDEKGEYHWYRLNGKSIYGTNGDVTKFVGTIQNSDDQISHENMLKDKAEHDLLTGLLNKITIQETVDRVVKATSHSVYAFYIIDLDNFKAVNDNLGHATGDKVLTDVASKLQLVFNEADYIGRLGGDEFAVLLVIPSVMTSQASKLISEKAKQLNEIMRAEYGDSTISINVSASIGISIYPEDGSDFQTLYQHADRALYHSKENGKNQFSFYTDVE